MEQVKFYSSKSNAKRAAGKAGVNLETAVLVEDGIGGFAYTAPSIDPMDKQYADQCGHSHCPSCGIHLSNGLLNVDDEGSNTKLTYREQRDTEWEAGEWMCMGCGAHFGEPVVYADKGTGIKIEKEREERNGLKRPSAGGVCRAIWDFCDAHQASTGFVPTAKEIKAAAEVAGWNANNASIEYYNWRKFMGIRGRQAKA